MKVISISGMRGSGKTTLIRELIARLSSAGQTSALIVNEDGVESYDSEFLLRHGVTAEFLRGG
jgi:molybdopterin-guanine dinucleotide biosynthesis protein